MSLTKIIANITRPRRASMEVMRAGAARAFASGGSRGVVAVAVTMG
jgi:hypothetical protein